MLADLAENLIDHGREWECPWERLSLDLEVVVGEHVKHPLKVLISCDRHRMVVVHLQQSTATQREENTHTHGQANRHMHIHTNSTSKQCIYIAEVHVHCYRVRSKYKALAISYPHPCLKTNHVTIVCSEPTTLLAACGEISHTHLELSHSSPKPLNVPSDYLHITTFFSLSVMSDQATPTTQQHKLMLPPQPDLLKAPLLRKDCTLSPRLSCVCSKQ